MEKENFVKLKVFKGKEENFVSLDIINLNKCKFDDKLIEVGEDTTDFCRMLGLQKKMEGFKFKTCINCLFYNYFCNGDKMKGGKYFCMPRLEWANKIEEEKFSLEKESSLSDLDYFNLRRRLILGEIGDMEKRSMKGFESCDNFYYIDPDEKLNLGDDYSKYRDTIRKFLGNEEDWYWPEQKKRYLDKVRKLKCEIFGESK